MLRPYEGSMKSRFRAGTRSESIRAKNDVLATSDAVAAFHAALDRIAELQREPSVYENVYFSTALTFLSTQPWHTLSVLKNAPGLGNQYPCTAGTTTVDQWRRKLRRFAH